MTIDRLTRAFLPAHIAVLSAVFVDALGAAMAAPDGGAGLLFSGAVYLLPAATIAAALLAVVSVLVERTLDELPLERSALVAGAALLVLLSYGIVHFTATSFRNQELASLLAAILIAVAVALTAGCVAAWAETAERLDRRLGQTGSILAWVGAASVVLLVSAWLILENRSGIAQLAPLVIAVPWVAALMFALAWASARIWSRVATAYVIAALLGGIVTLPAAFWMEVSDANAPPMLASHGPWSSVVAAAVQSVTDFDGDGTSSLMGGEDCAPFDDEVFPGAREVPGDGIDNNCVGGDAIKIARAAPPKWLPPPKRARRSNLVVITIDALRPDHTGFGGYQRDTTPNLDALAEESVVFSNYFANSTYTRLSLPALFSSLTPSELEWLVQRKKKVPRLSPRNPWLPQVLKGSGFQTAAILPSFAAFDRDTLGFRRGFDTYDVSTPLKYRGGTMSGFPAAQQVDAAIDFLDTIGRKRFALWLHFVEPHYAYERYPDSPDFGDDEIGRYDSEIWGVDHEIGRLLDYLEDARLMNQTVIFVTGDHGEEFHEHGQRFHGSNLYDPQVRTPALLRIPGLDELAVDEVVSSTDFAPTVSNLLGVKKDWKKWRGRNLLPLVSGKKSPPIESRPQILEVWKIQTRKKYKAAAVEWPHKLIFTEAGRKLELYDLEADPAETKNLIREGGDDAARLEGFLLGYLDAVDRTYRER